VLIVSRGGGSLEDLCLQRGVVARAIYDCALPVVSGSAMRLISPRRFCRRPPRRTPSARRNWSAPIRRLAAATARYENA